MTVEQVLLRTSNVRGVLTVLQTIKLKEKQDCQVVVHSDGLTVRLEDDSKALQAQALVRTELFSEFTNPGGGRVSFGLPYGPLMDTLAVFASLVTPTLTLRFPSELGQLLLEMDDQGLCTYAALASVQVSPPSELVDYWQDPSSYFILAGGLLKEAVDDLEWPQGDVAVALSRDPPAISLRASNVGSLEVQLPVEALSGFHCCERSVQHAYRYRHLHTAFAHIPVGKDPAAVSTKVTIDSNGIMKVQHMVSVGGPPHDPGAPTGATQGGWGDTQGDGFRAAGGQARAGVVTFFVLPKEQEEV